jgi:hypothetical protein
MAPILRWEMKAVMTTGGDRMNKCRVLHLDSTRGEDRMRSWDFTGNRPYLPPLMTEAVASIVYLVDEEPNK